MIVLVGPSASGKTATCRFLEDNYNIKKVVTHTTRDIRPGEKDGVDYHFVSKDEFEKMKKNNEFIETVFYNGNNYGTSRKEVKINKCMTVEPNGAKTYKSFNDPRIVLFYMHLDEKTCRERMLARGDDKDKVEARLKLDKTVFQVDEEMKSIIDVYADTKNHDLASVADFIYSNYIRILKERGIDYQKEVNDLDII